MRSNKRENTRTYSKPNSANKNVRAKERNLKSSSEEKKYKEFKNEQNHDMVFSFIMNGLSFL